MTSAPKMEHDASSSGGRLVSADGRTLPLKGAKLSADAKAGVIRVTLEQTFDNPHDEPLQVTYALPLPADGAVSGFAFRLGERRVVGEVDTKKRARERFEEAVLSGHTAALLDQERSSLFTQEVGNVPPRTQVVCEVVVDQKLMWLPDGCWEWRFPTVVAPRYLGGPGRVEDAEKVTVDVAEAPLPTSLGLALAIRDRLAQGARPESPSHSLHAAMGLEGRFDVTFGSEAAARLDRDVVVRWRVAEVAIGTSLDVARPAKGDIADAAYALMTLTPPVAEARPTPVPRDLIVLLDTSGSMSGEPLDQARRVAAALVDSLGGKDRLELIEFSSAPRRWKSRAVNATPANRKDAQAWLSTLRASGGTEMRAGILEALAPLREGAQRQVVLITDGLIGSEHEVLRAIAETLPKASRVHCVGVGSSVNRSLTMPAARAGRGVEHVIGLGEDAEVAAARVLARTAQPLVTDVEVSGPAVLELAPRRLPDLYGGAPALVSLKLKPEGGVFFVRGRTASGPFESRVTVDPVTQGAGSAAVTTLFAREFVEDLELSVQAGSGTPDTERRIEHLGLAFQVATRLTSWVAVSDEATVDPRAPRRRETMPQGLAHGLSAEGLGLRRPMHPGPVMACPAPSPARASPMPPPRARPSAKMPAYGQERSKLRAAMPASAPPPPRELPMGRAAPDGAASKGSGEVFRGGKAPRPDSAPPLGVRRLGARLLVKRDGLLAVEVTIDGEALVWAPQSPVMVELADGTIVRVAVDASRTTAEGTFAPGVSVALAVSTDGELGEVKRLTVASGDAVLELLLMV